MASCLLTEIGDRLVQEDGGLILLDLGNLMDLDQSGIPLQRAKVYMGPTVGWVIVYINPARTVTGGPVNLAAGDCTIFCNHSAPLTINLPPVAQALRQFQLQTLIGVFAEYFFIKDISGNAAVNNITITPNGAEKIDNLSQSFTIGQNRGVIRFYPLADGTGWASL